MSRENRINFNHTANSTGLGGGPRRSLETSPSDNNSPKSIRNETTKSKTKYQRKPHPQ